MLPGKPRCNCHWIGDEAEAGPPGERYEVAAALHFLSGLELYVTCRECGTKWRVEEHEDNSSPPDTFYRWFQEAWNEDDLAAARLKEQEDRRVSAEREARWARERAEEAARPKVTPPQPPPVVSKRTAPRQTADWTWTWIDDDGIENGCSIGAEGVNIWNNSGWGGGVGTLWSLERFAEGGDDGAIPPEILGVMHARCAELLQKYGRTWSRPGPDGVRGT